MGIDIPDTWAAKEWLEDRDHLLNHNINTVEDYLKTKPFETYPLFKGALKSNGTSSIREVGKFKGIIAITEFKTEEPLVPLDKTLLEYVARVYVWKGADLQPSDPNGKADPYLKCSLGSFSQSGRKDHLKATLHPDFYAFYEIPVQIPGESTLKLSVYDWDRFHLPGVSDTLIGETTIDIEDRWFHKKWKAMGKNSAQASLTGNPKFIETRDLFKPTSSNSQGKLYLWLEILPTSEARAKPPIKFEKPPEMEIEIRVIVWALRGYSTSESSLDYFVKTYLKGTPKKKMETDTHWRSKTGGAQWNYRHKHHITVPLDNPAKADLVVELWDRDIIGSNDSLGNFTFPLNDWLKKCYIEQRSIKPFELITIKQQGDDEEPQAITAGDDEEEEKEEGDGEGEVTNPLNDGPPSLQPMLIDDDQYADDGVEVEDEFQMNELKSEGSSEEEDDGDENTALLGKDGDDDGVVVKRKKKKEKPENIVNMLKAAAGLPVDRDDGHWFDMLTTDVESGQTSLNGQVMITVELIPKEQADASMVGHGRSEPNTNPNLPPPMGRLSIGLDPCSILWALLTEFPGAVLCCCCCCCLITLLALFMVGGTYISALSSLGFSL